MSGPDWDDLDEGDVDELADLSEEELAELFDLPEEPAPDLLAGYGRPATRPPFEVDPDRGIDNLPSLDAYRGPP